MGQLCLGQCLFMDGPTHLVTAFSSFFCLQSTPRSFFGIFYPLTLSRTWCWNLSKILFPFSDTLALRDKKVNYTGSMGLQISAHSLPQLYSLFAPVPKFVNKGRAQGVQKCKIETRVVRGGSDGGGGEERRGKEGGGKGGG